MCKYIPFMTRQLIPILDEAGNEIGATDIPEGEWFPGNSRFCSKCRVSRRCLSHTLIPFDAKLTVHPLDPHLAKHRNRIVRGPKGKPVRRYAANGEPIAYAVRLKGLTFDEVVQFENGLAYLDWLAGQIQSLKYPYAVINGQAVPAEGPPELVGWVYGTFAKRLRAYLLNPAIQRELDRYFPETEETDTPYTVLEEVTRYRRGNFGKLQPWTCKVPVPKHPGRQRREPMPKRQPEEFNLWRPLWNPLNTTSPHGPSRIEGLLVTTHVTHDGQRISLSQAWGIVADAINFFDCVTDPDAFKEEFLDNTERRDRLAQACCLLRSGNLSDERNFPAWSAVLTCVAAFHNAEDRMLVEALNQYAFDTNPRELARGWRPNPLRELLRKERRALRAAKRRRFYETHA